MKRLLQYSCLYAKNNHALFRSRLTLSRSLHIHSSPTSSPSTQHVLPTCFLLRSCSRLCFCFSYLVPSTLFLTCSVSLACMYTLHASQLRWRVQRTRLCISSPLPYMLPYCTCTLLISCFVAPCTYFILYFTSLLCTCTAYF